MPIHSPQQAARRRHASAVLAVLWLVIVLASIPLITDHLARPGQDAARPLTSWLENDQLSLYRPGYTLLLFAHPQCPCTASTIAQIHRVLAGTHSDRVRAHLVVPLPLNSVKQESTEPACVTPVCQLEATALRNDPSLLTRVQDPDASLTRLFGMRTSGHCLLFDQEGQLLFSGGITPLRGHEGDCPGILALVACLHGHKPRVFQTPVFGCALYQGEPHQSQASLANEEAR